MAQESIGYAPRPVHGQARWRQLFRSFGIELLSMWTSEPSAQEHPKIAIQTSRSLAWCSCSVHILPIGIAVTLVSVNLSGLYCGYFTGDNDSPSINIALLQIAAKLEELLIMASLTTIVVHSIRKELIAGTGVPLGILGGGFLYTSVGYFWSPAFWGSLKAKTSRNVKFRLYSLLVVCGIIAATAGPSSAVLMIPRLRIFDAGGGEIYIPGNESTRWPNSVSFGNPRYSELCGLRNATENPVCPSAAYASLKYSAKTGFLLLNPGGSFYDLFSISKTVEQFFDIAGQVSAIPNYFLHGTPRITGCHSSIIGTDLKEATLLFKVLSDWVSEAGSIPYNFLEPSISQYKHNQAIYSKSQTMVKVPAVRVACADAQNMSSSAREVHFPALKSNDCWDLRTNQYNITNLNGTPTDRIRTQWIPTPPLGQTGHTGMVFEAPWERSTGTRVVVGCTVDARWAPGAGFIKLGAPAQGNVHQASGTSHFGISPFRPSEDNSWKPIHLEPNYLEALIPPAPNDYSNQKSLNRSILEEILDNMEIASQSNSDGDFQTQTDAWNTRVVGGLNRTVSLEWILASLVASGLSRQRISDLFDTSLPMHEWSPRYYERNSNFRKELFRNGNPLKKPNGTSVTKERVRVSVQGYSFMVNLVTDYMAIAVLLAYICLAMWHTIELVLRLNSSNSWETLTELLALTLQSPPAKVLQNTGAGIAELRTYAATAKVYAVRDTDGSDVKPSSIEASLSAANEDGSQPQMQLSLTNLHGDSEHLTDTSSQSAASADHSHRWRVRSLPARLDHEQRHSNQGHQLHSVAKRTGEKIRVGVTYS